MKNCTKHPRYKGIRPPARSCQDCVCVYLEVKGFNKVLDTGSTMSNILFNIAQDMRVPEDWRIHAKQQQTNWDAVWFRFRDNFTKL